ncbi:MAG TPA: bacteriophage abortive infection AbiH family protein [Paludibacter sp.]
MKPKKLYIVGNGFDLYHGIKSLYRDFRYYLEEEDPALLLMLEKYFDDESLWSDFEETLADLDIEQIFHETRCFFVQYGDDNWSDANHHDYEYEVQQRIDKITCDLKILFTKWILQLELPYDAICKKLQLNNNDFFINFNYTDTIESLYNIPSKNILYIHNKAINIDSTLILGHSRNLKTIKSFCEYINDEDTDVRDVEGNKILDSYFELTYKSTKEIIKQNILLFNSLNTIDEIIVLGHSLSEVDLPYLKKIIQKINRKTTKWKISAYNIKELTHHKHVMINLGVKSSLIEYGTIKDFDESDLTLFPKCKL